MRSRASGFDCGMASTADMLESIALDRLVCLCYKTQFPPAQKWDRGAAHRLLGRRDEGHGATRSDFLWL